MRTYRILSLDGGGIRGLVSTVLLQRLCAAAGLHGWLDEVDLIAGTSTGGLVALGLANGLSIAELRALYELRGPLIFDDSWLDNVVDVGQLSGAQYGSRRLRRELRRVFGDVTLGQLGRRVLITAFDLDNEAPQPQRRTWKPKLFHNFPGPDGDGDVPAYKVGLYTSAAPTYFPSVDGYIDGAVYANNPSMCGLAQALDRRWRRRPRLTDIRLLSIGTGTPMLFVRGRNLDWGYVQWAQPIISLMLDGMADVADFQCRQLLGARYHRIAPHFPADISVPVDGVEHIPFLVDFAEKLDLRPAIRWLRRHW